MSYTPGTVLVSSLVKDSFSPMTFRFLGCVNPGTPMLFLGVAEAHRTWNRPVFRVIMPSGKIALVTSSYLSEYKP